MDLNSFKEFFQDNLCEFQKNYPGITLKRILEDIDESTDFNYLREQLLLRRPLEHIFGRKYFYKSYFYVNSNVLIPRSETEILVEKSVEYLKDFPNACVLDIGTGSGCIPCSIAKEVNNEVQFVVSDISSHALEVANTNYKKLNIKNDFTFFCTDRMNGINKKFNLITSNPPYIKSQSDKEKVHVQVVQYEPHLALFLEDDEYDQWFEELFNQVNNHLYTGGLFIMEGHEDHLKGLKELASDVFQCDTIIEKDYTNRDRFLLVRK